MVRSKRKLSTDGFLFDRALLQLCCVWAPFCPLCWSPKQLCCILCRCTKITLRDLTTCSSTWVAQLATVRAIQFDSQRASDLKYICDIFRVVNKQYCIAILGIVNIVFSIAKVVQYFVLLFVLSVLFQYTGKSPIPIPILFRKQHTSTHHGTVVELYCTNGWNHGKTRYRVFVTEFTELSEH